MVSEEMHEHTCLSRDVMMNLIHRYIHYITTQHVVITSPEHTKT
jgi:hypothetical protein